MPDLPEELAAVLRARAADAPAPPGPDDAVVRRVRRRAGLRAGAATSGVAVAIVAVVAAGAAVSNKTSGNDAVAGADCRPVTSFPLDDLQPDHPMEPIDYDRTPPNSGPHDPRPVPRPERRYDVEDAPPVERVVHNLEHGWVVVWYDAGRADTTRLDAALLSADFPKMFAVPWTRGGLPAPYVVTAWGHEQRCAEVDGATLEEFAAEHGGENGDAPEPRAP